MSAFKLPQIYTVSAYIFIGKVSWFAVIYETLNTSIIPHFHFFFLACFFAFLSVPVSLSIFVFSLYLFIHLFSFPISNHTIFALFYGSVSICPWSIFYHCSFIEWLFIIHCARVEGIGSHQKKIDNWSRCAKFLEEIKLCICFT